MNNQVKQPRSFDVVLGGTLPPKQRELVEKVEAAYETYVSADETTKQLKFQYFMGLYDAYKIMYHY